MFQNKMGVGVVFEEKRASKNWISQSERVVNRLIKANPNIKQQGMFADVLETMRFLKDTRGEFEETCKKKQLAILKEALPSPRFTPDAYEIIACERGLATVRIYEVVDTNDITLKKLTAISDFWWNLDCEDWGLEVVRLDVSGRETHRIDDVGVMKLFYFLERLQELRIPPPPIGVLISKFALGDYA